MDDNCFHAHLCFSMLIVFVHMTDSRPCVLSVGERGEMSGVILKPLCHCKYHIFMYEFGCD